jgi:hypothetical protein
MEAARSSGVPAEIRVAHLQNARQKHYRLRQLARFSFGHTGFLPVSRMNISVIMELLL